MKKIPAYHVDDCDDHCDDECDHWKQATATEYLGLQPFCQLELEYQQLTFHVSLQLLTFLVLTNTAIERCGNRE